MTSILYEKADKSSNQLISKVYSNITFSYIDKLNVSLSWAVESFLYMYLLMHKYIACVHICPELSLDITNHYVFSNISLYNY